jgi:uncharacterized protein (TIGR00290 family)
MDAAAGRVPVHSVRESLLDAQAEAAGLPLQKVPLPWPCGNADYEQAVGGVLGAAKAAGVRGVAFGDLFLEDIRAWREALMARAGMTPLFPLWGRPTRALAEEMIDAGMRALVVAVDCKQLPARFAGREFDRDFLKDLPAAVDPCGERGEFHTFTWAGPMLRAPIPVRIGEVTEVNGFASADVRPI